MAKTFEWVKEHQMVAHGAGVYYVNCDQCGKVRPVLKSTIRKKILRGDKKLYCSKSCSNYGSKKYFYLNGLRTKTVPCVNCNSPISKSGKYIFILGKYHCNIKCAMIENLRISSVAKVKERGSSISVYIKV